MLKTLNPQTLNQQNLNHHNSGLVQLTKQLQITFNKNHVFAFNITRSVRGRFYLAIDLDIYHISSKPIP